MPPLIKIFCLIVLSFAAFTSVVEGEIVDGDQIKFRDLAKKIPNAIVSLKSSGGLIEPALEIGRMVWFNGMATYVEEADCASACGLIWLAGYPRVVSTNGRVGFHAVHYRNLKSLTKESSVGNALVGAYLSNLGLGKRVIEYATAENPKSMRWLTEDDAKNIGLEALFLDREFRAIDLFNAGIQHIMKSQGKVDQTAVEFYLQSSRMGFAGAQNNLGDLYETANGVAQSDLAAVHWYTRAAERGEPTAYYSLAAMLAKSEDIEVLIDALKFAILGVDNLPEGSNKEGAFTTLREISSRLPLSAREKAQQLSDAWRPLYQESALLSDDPSPSE
jgi:hypothetical protein